MPGRLATRLRRWRVGVVDPGVAAWRTGSRRSQAWTAGLLVVGVAVSLVISLVRYDLMPLSAYFVWLLLGAILLRYGPLLVLCLATLVAAVIAAFSTGEINGARITVIVALVLSVLLLLSEASRQRSGLPGRTADGMLADLRDRLQAQGKVPPLPAGWSSQSAMLAAHGSWYAGDFLVADLDDDGRHLEMILVDVCGKGMDAATQALQFAGALGGLIRALPPLALLEAANDFLLRQFSDESFATAVHVIVDLRTGGYSITSAGHPPALRWERATGSWQVDNSRGTALGVTRRPEFTSSTGVLEPGEALLFYTDGVVESRTASFDDGLAWLRATAGLAVGDGFDGAAQRIVRQVVRGDDDRAVLMVVRDPVPAAAAVAPTPTPLMEAAPAPEPAPEPAPAPTPATEPTPALTTGPLASAAEASRPGAVPTSPGDGGDLPPLEGGQER